jgi:phosphoglycolate phosphatase-like HAD superfamily hydrolase
VKRRLVLFDIDGTLLLSGGAGRRAILAALGDEARIGNRAVAAVRFDGKTDPQIAAELLAAAGDPTPEDPARIAALLARYLKHLEAELSTDSHGAALLPGVAELLDLVEAVDGVLLGLLTGNLDAGATLKLRSVTLDPARFRVGAYGSDHAVRASLPPIAAGRAAPHFGRTPTGREVVIIGDTPADVTCGRGIGAVSVGVATGQYSAAELRAAGADLVFDNFSDAAGACRAILESAP